MTALPPAKSDRQSRSSSSSPTIKTLKLRQDFLSCARAPKWVTSSFLVQARNRCDADPDIRVGYTASKKVGGAILRNRAKRRLRALARQIISSQVKSGYDIVLVARHKNDELPWESMQRNLIWALKRLDILKESGSGPDTQADRKTSRDKDIIP